jgi:thioredoxin 1
MANPNVVEFTVANFEAEVLQSDKPVLVDFWGGWSEGCRTMAAMLEEIAADCGGALKVVRVDVDENVYLAAQHGIGSIPTLILYQGGRPVGRIVGQQPKHRLMSMVGPYIGRGGAAPAMPETAASDWWREA